MASNMTIGRRFIVTSGALLALSTMLAVVAICSLNGIGNHVKTLGSGGIPGVLDAGAVRGDLFLLRGYYLKHINEISPADMAAADKSVATGTALLAKDIQAYEDQIGDDTVDRANFAKIKAEIDAVQQGWQKVLPVSRSGKKTDAYVVYKAEVSPALDHLKPMLTDLVDYNNRVCNTELGSATHTIDFSWWMTFGMTVVALVTGVGLSWFMVSALNRELTGTIAELTENAAQIASAAGQVASSSQSLAQGSSEQAATIEETSSASSEISSMARRNTENSQTATGIVTQSEAGFRTANQSLDEMVGAMDGISSSSQKIAKIIKVIDEISFQTNILALNAAVEAARAGEAGMGFAVVADEVRNLAQRCAQAAKDTAELIEDSIEKSNGGKIKVGQVAVAIRAITAESAKIKILVEEINLGSAEQSRGIDQISSSITQMEQVTQSSAAGAEQGAAAAEQLNAQAESLNEVVDRLSRMVNNNGSQGRARRSPRPAGRSAVAADANLAWE